MTCRFCGTDFEPPDDNLFKRAWMIVHEECNSCMRKSYERALAEQEQRGPFWRRK